MITSEEMDHIKSINRRYEYCLSESMMKSLSKRHKKAREQGDTHEMELIEWRLTDINFHTECGLLASGQYDKIDEIIRKGEF